MIRHKLIQELASSLLNEAGVTSPGFDVKHIAHLRGAIVIEEPNDDDASGFLFRSTDSPPVIGVNSRHAPTRKRFTIAHEIGHLMLHPKTGVHFDRVVIQMRDANASAGVDREEIEANKFAAELLMPRQFLEADVASLGAVCADDETAIARLAKRYAVSPQAMAIRLNTLNLLLM